MSPDAEAIHRQQQHKGCFVLGTNIEVRDLSDEEVIAAYKAQSQVEGGFQFLKDPLFFVSSLFVKKPSRIQGLLMVMTLALLIYSVAQRRLHQALVRQQESRPNQIHHPTQRPALRWIFQLLEGIHRVRVIVQGQVHDLIEGLNQVQIKILRLFGQHVCQIYQISSGEGLLNVDNRARRHTFGWFVAPGNRSYSGDSVPGGSTMTRRILLAAMVILATGCDGSDSAHASDGIQVAQYQGAQQQSGAAGREQTPGVYRLQRVGIIDQVGFEQPMVAVSALIPHAWHTHGGVVWSTTPNLCMTTGFTFNWVAVSPDGTMGAMLFPGMGWGTNNTGQPIAPGCPRMQISSVQQYLEFIVQQSRPGAQILDFRPRPDVAQELSAVNGLTPMPMGEMRRWSEGGEVLIAYQQAGRDYRETLAASVIFSLTRIQAPGMGVMETLTAEAPNGYAFRAPNGQLDFKMAETIRRSFDIAPQWEARINQHQAQVANIVATAARRDARAIFQTWEDISAMRRDSFELWNNTNDRRYREFSDAMRGLITYNEPLSLTGEVQLTNQWRDAYRLGDGTYVVTDNLSFNPYAKFGQNAMKLERRQ